MREKIKLEDVAKADVFPTQKEIEENGGMEVPASFVEKELDPMLEKNKIAHAKETPEQKEVKVRSLKDRLLSLFEKKPDVLNLDTYKKDVMALNTITIDSLSADTGRGSSTLQEYTKMITKYNLGQAGLDAYNDILEQAKKADNTKGTAQGPEELENLNEMKRNFYNLMRSKVE